MWKFSLNLWNLIILFEKENFKILLKLYSIFKGKYEDENFYLKVIFDFLIKN